MILLLLKDQSVVCLATRQIKAFGNKLVLTVRRKTTHNCRTLLLMSYVLTVASDIGTCTNTFVNIYAPLSADVFRRSTAKSSILLKNPELKAKQNGLLVSGGDVHVKPEPNEASSMQCYSQRSKY